MRTSKWLQSFAVIACGVCWSSVAHADTRAGSARALVVASLQVAEIDNLRFGRFFQPTSAGNLTISATGTVTGTGGMSGAPATVQFSGGRGAGHFLVSGEPGRSFRVNLPNRIDISNGAATMRVSNFTDNVPSSGTNLSASGTFTIAVGARLQVAGAQAVGSYSGQYTLTVFYD